MRSRASPPDTILRREAAIRGRAFQRAPPLRARLAIFTGHMNPVTVIALILGFLLGIGVCLFALRGRLRLERAQGKAEGNIENASLQSQILHLRARQGELERQARDYQDRIGSLTETKGGLEAQVEAERKRALESREHLMLEFKQLAEGILEEKTKKFTEQNRTNLEGILNPLGLRIKEFEKKVEDAYGKERDQVIALSRDIENLKQTSLKMSLDAVNLTNALKGQSKVQGNLGEIILERVLEKSGLTRDREYRIQVAMNDGDGKRRYPDVIVDLPEGKHIVIDSKVSLTAYERYFSAEDNESREVELKNHIRSIRAHLESLSLKGYQNLYQLQSLDFVFLFMPIEPALILAVQNDVDLFQDAFSRNVVIVSPSTLLATLRMVSSIWRQEGQNRNTIEIARQAGAMHDKFVGFLEDLKKVGSAMAMAQKSYDDALVKLNTGTGNLVGRAAKLKLLGVKTSKEIPEAMLPLQTDLIEEASAAVEEGEG
jgi:DNA recombination protein RmuC